MPFDLALSLVVGVWLVVISVHDAKTLEVPPALTILPLLAVAAYRVAHPPEGGLWPGGIAVLVALLMVLVSDRVVLAVLFAGVAGALAHYAGPATFFLVIGWTLALATYKIGLWAEADGKVFMTLLALWPTWPLAAAMVLCFILGNFLGLWRHYGQAAPLALANTARDVAQRVPAAEQHLHHLAGVPWLSLGAVVYLGLQLGGVW